MDPDRVRAYLQVACAGLGFDIGEVWWTSNENGTSTVASIENKNENSLAVTGGVSCHPRFVQLYTSKSFAEKRSMLVNPDEEDDNDNNYNNTSIVARKSNSNANSDRNLSKHVLSPLMVDAISKTAQVVWANTKKQEGLIGRSDIRLQTAVGMPVAIDNNGNMCIVVMFSPNNIQSTDDAVEYLQSISQSATSSSIPALLPVFAPNSGILAVMPHHNRSNQFIPLLASSLNDGVETRFVSLEVDPSNALLKPGAAPEIHTKHELAAAPKDCFGIPMLPSFAELGGTGSSDDRGNVNGGIISDAFDEASYGVWSTIMETMDDTDIGPLFESRNPEESNGMSLENSDPFSMSGETDFFSGSAAPARSYKKATMSKQRKERLEEFASAFLNVSVFDLADVWIPLDGHLDYLSHIMAVTSSHSSESLNNFMKGSENILVKFWSGAVGRAFSSGNPVWSANPDVFVDSGRTDLFAKSNFQTALAVPIFSAKSASPACVLCCYSYVRTGSVPFVLKFVQQALRLLWDGLDKVEPHESVGRDLWRDVAPADLGEMAADVEMQQHFLHKKRPRSSISATAPSQEHETSLSEQLNALGTPSGFQSMGSLYAGQQAPSPRFGEPATHEYGPSDPSIQFQALEAVQGHFFDAVKHVAQVVPFQVHRHVQTNVQGSKRAHVLESDIGYQPTSIDQSQYQPEFQPTSIDQSQYQPEPTSIAASQYQSTTYAAPTYQQPTQRYEQIYDAYPATQNYGFDGHAQPDSHAPLPMPRPLPLPNQLMMQPQVRSSHPQNNHVQQQQASVYMTERSQQQETQHISQSDQHGHIPNNQGGSSIHFNHQFNSHVQTAMSPSAPVPLARPTSISPVPTNQLSATGIIFAMPQIIQSSPASTISMSDGSMSTGASHVVTAASMSYCVPATGNNAVPTSGKPCRIQGCSDPSVVRRPYCVRHSGNRLCEHDGCMKCAQGSTRFCIAHGGGRRCTFAGCDKGARDKFFCAAHGGGKRCRFDGCGKSAVGGSQLCTAHGGGRRCSVDGCDKSAQSSTKYCVKHGGGKKCCHPGCEKVARGRTEYCAAHGGGVRCKLEGCNRVAIGKLQLCRAHGGGARSRSKNSSDEGDDDEDDYYDDDFQEMSGMPDVASV